MKKTTLAAVLIVLCGGLAACGPKPEPVAPAATVIVVEAPPAPPAPPPPPPEPMPAPDAMPAPDDGMEGDDTDGEIAPHAGGDKVNKAPEAEPAVDAGS